MHTINAGLTDRRCKDLLASGTPDERKRAFDELFRRGLIYSNEQLADNASKCRRTQSHFDDRRGERAFA